MCNSFVGRHHQVKTEKLWPTSARALHKTLRPQARARRGGAAGFSSHACALQFTTFCPELLDRAQLTEQLSHIQSELAAGTQIHYNTKCAV